ncbi:MAG: hypothetical protein M1837_000557 [Sclerophora amabilis]|nr:MAG: hypothetical protein M1837_000557 [Sclerophora amabilis]
MAAMNAVGGPVGGVQMMNNGTAGLPRNGNRQEESKSRLNTYIYDYLLKNELFDCARSLHESGVPLLLEKASPGRRRHADGTNLNNGVDEHSMDADTKDDLDSKIPDDLPSPKLTGGDATQNSFLLDWWGVFWDIYFAQQSKNRDGAASQYLQHSQNQHRLRQEQRMFQQMNPSGMGQYAANMMRISGMNMNPQDLQRKALQNSRNPTPAQQAQMAKNHMLTQMQREGSHVDVNGEQRAQSPSSAENAPSPSKRPRLENGTFGQPMMPNGRGQPPGAPGMQGQQVGAAPHNPMNAAAMQAHQLLHDSGINPQQLTPAQFNSFQSQNPAVQAKSIEVYAQNVAHARNVMGNQTMQKGMTNPGGMPNQPSPMMGGVPDGQMQNMAGLYAGNPAQLRGMAPGGATPNGNHALQDYQMQLMLLEQQNKRRLLMARQEQDSLSGRGDQLGPGGQPGFQGMSPQGSRSGPSPNPQDQMKRGTPKMNQPGLPGSPMPDGNMPQNRSSPAAMGFAGGQMPADMTPGLYQHMTQMKENMVGVPNGNMMRPPSSHPPGFNGQPISQQQVEALRQQQMAGRLPNQNPNWQQPAPGQPPVVQQSPQNTQQQTLATPQQRAQMPPPQAPPTAAANNNNNNNNNNTTTTTTTQNRTQPSSPQQPAAPPTPQQSNKANPKKGEKERTRKKPVKKGSTAQPGAASSSEAEPPPTPTPSTPITPVHSNSFNAAKGPNGPAQAPPASQPQTSAPAAPVPIAQPPPNATQPFSIDGNEGFPNMDSSYFEPDMLETFDFDTFLNTTDEAGGDGGLGFDIGNLAYPNPDGVEAGNGDV